MPEVLYHIDGAIESFFSRDEVAPSRMQCDDFARRRCGDPVVPVDVQGITSYTVVAGPAADKIVQFREKSSLLDLMMVALARKMHGDLVPNCAELGWIGDGDGLPLAIYEMDRLPGQNYIVTRPSLAHAAQLNTIRSLASFFAQAWRSGGLKTKSTLANTPVGDDTQTRLQHLADTLPTRFLPVVAQSQAALPSFLDGDYPVVLTHGDLNEMNILVDPHSGTITGIVDWAEASMQPFGFALYALENALGSMGPNGWRWFDGAGSMREAFWESFRKQTGLSERQEEVVRIAAKAGILMRYGTAYDSGFRGMVGVRDPDSEDFQYLDALLL